MPENCDIRRGKGYRQAGEKRDAAFPSGAPLTATISSTMVRITIDPEVAQIKD